LNANTDRLYKWMIFSVGKRDVKLDNLMKKNIVDDKEPVRKEREHMNNGVQFELFHYKIMIISC